MRTVAERSTELVDRTKLKISTTGVNPVSASEAWVTPVNMSNEKPYRLNDDALNAIRELRRRFREETGRDPGPDDDCAYNPDSAETQPAAEARIKSIMGDIADAAGLAPDLAFAIRKTGLLVTQRNQDGLDDDQRAAWNDAIAEYKMRKHLN